MDQDGEEELMTYNQVMDHLNRDLEIPVVLKFKRIVSHQGPLKPHDKDYKGSLYNVMIEWEGREITAVLLSIIAKDDPVTCAIYAKENDVLEYAGWKDISHWPAVRRSSFSWQCKLTHVPFALHPNINRAMNLVWYQSEDFERNVNKLVVHGNIPFLILCMWLTLDAKNGDIFHPSEWEIDNRL
jgi:hypothetical protein